MHAKHLQQSLAHSGNISHRRFTWHLHRPTTQYEVSVVLLVGMVRLKSDVIIMIIIIINTFGNLGEVPKEWPRSVTDGPLGAWCIPCGLGRGSQIRATLSQLA